MRTKFSTAFTAFVIQTDVGFEVFPNFASKNGELELPETKLYPLPPDLVSSKRYGKLVFGDFGELVQPFK